MAFKALYDAVTIDLRNVGAELPGASIRSCGTNVLMHRAINNSVKNSFKYHAGESWNCMYVAAKTAENLRFFKKLI